MTTPTKEEIKEQDLKDLEDGKEEYYKRQDEKKKAGILQAEELSEKDKKYYRKNISHGPIPEFEKVVDGNGNGKAKKSTKNKKDSEEKDSEENDKEFFFKFAESYMQLLFKDQFGTLFACVKINNNNNNNINDKYDLISLTSNKFVRYLYKIFYESENKIILTKEDRNEIIEHLQYKAEFSGIIKKLDLRVARTADNDYTFYYDLTNNNDRQCNKNNT